MTVQYLCFVGVIFVFPIFFSCDSCEKYRLFTAIPHIGNSGNFKVYFLAIAVRNTCHFYRDNTWQKMILGAKDFSDKSYTLKNKPSFLR